MKYTKLNLSKEKDGDCWVYALGEKFKQYQEHTHEELEVNIIISGHATYLISGKKYHLKENSHCWLFPNHPHLLLNASVDFKMWVAVFKKSLLQRLVLDGADPRLLMESFLGRVVNENVKKENDQLIPAFEETNRLSGERALHNSSIALLCLKVWKCFESGKKAHSISISVEIQKALQLIQQKKHLSLDELSLKLNMSPSNLSRLFKKEIGLNVSHYKQKVSLEHFMSLWQNSPDINILKACLESGFGSYAQFYRVFSQNFGYGPAEYKRKLRV
jgi:AraC-like DNA-binding protein